MIFAFQNDPGVPRVTLRQKVEAGATYMVNRVDGTPVGSALSGADLMVDGIEFDRSPESAAHVLLLRKNPANGAAAGAGAKVP